MSDAFETFFQSGLAAFRKMAEGELVETRGRDPLRCLACGSTVSRLDQSIVVRQGGPGWSKTIVNILTECAVCGARRLRLKETTEFDQGDFEKRSLR